MRFAVALGACGLTFALGACGAPADSPAAIADQTTKAVYNVDVDGTEAHMADDLKNQVTRASIGDLSDKMHALGAYKGVKQTSSDPDKGLYAFEASFDRGTLAVNLRLDPTGKIGAYRVSPATH